MDNNQVSLNFEDFISVIEKEARSYHFYQLVFLLESNISFCDPIKPVIQQVGEIGLINNKRTLDEYIRFRPHASLGFPKSDIESLEYLNSEKYQQKNIFQKDPHYKSPYFRMELNFLGLYGVSSPLPIFYTEAIINTGNLPEAIQHSEGSPRRDFLDIFNHRIYSLLYQVWKKYRYYIHYAATEFNTEDIFSEQLFSLIGVGSSKIRENSELQWIRLLPYAGLLTMRVRSAKIMAQIISHYFSVIFQSKLTVSIEECVLRWVNIDKSQQNSLGKQRTTMAENFIIGSRIKDYDGKFRVHLTKLNFTQYLSFLPNGKYYKALNELIKFLCLEPLEFDILLSLNLNETPQWQLGKEKRCRLGWSNWTKNRKTPGVVILKGGV